jgi:anaerobic C4-dicarboxylate transporter
MKTLSKTAALFITNWILLGLTYSSDLYDAIEIPLRRITTTNALSFISFLIGLLVIILVGVVTNMRFKFLAKKTFAMTQVAFLLSVFGFLYIILLTLKNSLLF